MANAVCSVDACECKAVCRGWCKMHYKRWLRNGDPNKVHQAGLPCSIDGCGRKVHGGGLCKIHYQRKGRYGDPLLTHSVRNVRLCSIDRCGRKHKGGGYCEMHWRRFRKHGDPCAWIDARAPDGAPMKFLEKSLAHDDDKSCLIWPYYFDKVGARISVDGVCNSVCRIVCERIYGAPPSPKYQVAHSCGKAHLGCVNPHHLRWDTPKGNNADKLLHGTHNRGERHALHILTEQDVFEIRKLEMRMSNVEIGRLFGVTDGAIRCVLSGRTWGWLK